MSESKTILIVDDSKVSRMMIKAIIKDIHPDWLLLEAGNAEEAMECSNDFSIDYFSIDLNMPGKDGLELIELLKPQSANSKFALLTANIQAHIHESATALGARCFNKPITPDSIGNMLSYFND